MILYVSWFNSFSYEYAEVVQIIKKNKQQIAGDQSGAGLSYSKKSLMKAVLCTALFGYTTFWSMLILAIMFVVLNLYTKPHYTYCVIPAAQLWVCMILYTD